MNNASLSRRTFIRHSAITIPLIPAAATVANAAPFAKPDHFKLRFAVASDGHFGMPGTDYERFHKNIIRWLNDEARFKGLDFVVFNGDLIHNRPEFLPEVKKVYEQLLAPYYVTRGNHDHVPEDDWKSTWGYPSNHSVVVGNAAVLLVSSATETGRETCVDVSWLKQELAAHAAREHIFVFIHVSQKKWSPSGKECPEATQLLEATQNVTAVFFGHDHQLDNMMLSNGLAYFFDGHIGGNFGTFYHGYRIVEMSQDDRIVSYQCNPEAFIVNANKISRKTGSGTVKFVGPGF